MEPFDEEKKLPDFFANRAQVRLDADDEDTASDETVEPVQDDASVDEVPYDFRAEYKERIDRSFADEGDDAEKNFFSVRMHAIGIGVLIGVLVALLVSVFLFGSADDTDTLDEPIVVSESTRPLKERPSNRGGMDIPDQDKTIYKRMRSDELDTQVERLVVTPEAPVRPQVPTKEGEVLGTPRSMAKSAEEMELEVLSVQQKAVQAPVAKPVAPKAVKAPVVEVKKEPVKVQSAVPVTKPAAKTTAAAAPKKSADVWYVQLISLPSKSGAEKAWPKILKAHTALLSGLSHNVAEVQIKGKGTFYRLRVGGFNDKKEAQNLCNKLKARKQDCALTK